MDTRRRTERMNGATFDTNGENFGSHESSVPVCTIEDLGDEVHLRLDQRVSWAVALKILSLLKADNS